MARIPFLRRVASFDLENAAALAWAAELAYDGPEAIEATARNQWQFDQFRFVDEGGTQGYLAADDDTILVAFRGTESDQLEDWIADANVDLVDGPMHGRVHAGFYDALSHVWQLVDQYVLQLEDGRPKWLWLTGHSLGAAVATLAAARWIERGRRVRGLYTFGQPRTGDKAFARNFNFACKPSTFRIVNNNDLVTRIPPRSFGYSHLGTFKYFTRAGQLVDDINWWSHFLDRWKVVVDDVFDWARDGIRDHSMSGYRRLVENQLELARPRQLEVRLLQFLDKATQRVRSNIRPRRVA